MAIYDHVSINYTVNRGLEKYKLIEAQRVADTSDVVKACTELWTKAYEYESLHSKINGLKHDIWFFEKSGGNQIPYFVDRNQKNKEIITDLEKLVEEKEEQFTKALDERRFIIGEPLAQHFFIYVGLVKEQADFHLRALTAKDEKSREIPYKAYESLEKQIISMRFTALVLREYAISKLPR